MRISRKASHEDTQYNDRFSQCTKRMWE